MLKTESALWRRTVVIGFGIWAVGSTFSLCWGLYGIYQNLTEPKLVVAMAIASPVATVISTPIETQPGSMIVEDLKTVGQPAPAVSGADNVAVSENVTPNSGGCVRVGFTAVTGVVPPR